MKGPFLGAEDRLKPWSGSDRASVGDGDQQPISTLRRSRAAARKMESMRIDVLGAVRAFHDDGTPVDLGGPRHREVLARLVAAGGRMVSTDSLVDDLWAEPPVRAVGALRTFVAALRRAIEPDRPPRTPPQVLVTEGPGYALRLPPHAVDVHRFEDALSRARRTPDGLTGLDAALAAWRGPAYADVTGSAWAQREQTRLEELRLEGVELRARLILDAGSGAELVADLGAHVTEHPWREPAWGCWPAHCTGPTVRRTHWPPSAAPAQCSRTSLGSTPAPTSGAWRRTSSTEPRRSNPHTPCGPQADSARAPPSNWPAPCLWQVATPSSTRGATASPPYERPNAPATSS